ncbi:hypothetical protein MICRO8M_70060 [Microbacterium sp. 8M]|nr:hypothetical protein MICRO8M_70060 [Microbacterium sp. 8M]
MRPGRRETTRIRAASRSLARRTPARVRTARTLREAVRQAARSGEGSHLLRAHDAQLRDAGAVVHRGAIVGRRHPEPDAQHVAAHSRVQDPRIRDQRDRVLGVLQGACGLLRPGESHQTGRVAQARRNALGAHLDLDEAGVLFARMRCGVIQQCLQLRGIQGGVCRVRGRRDRVGRRRDRRGRADHRHRRGGLVGGGMVGEPREQAERGGDHDECGDGDDEHRHPPPASPRGGRLRRPDGPRSTMAVVLERRDHVGRGEVLRHRGVHGGPALVLSHARTLAPPHALSQGASLLAGRISRQAIQDPPARRTGVAPHSGAAFGSARQTEQAPGKREQAPGKRKDPPRTRQSPVTLAAFPPWGSWPGCRHAESRGSVYPRPRRARDRQTSGTTGRALRSRVPDPPQWGFFFYPHLPSPFLFS